MSFEQFDEAEKLEREGKREEALAAYTDFIKRHGCDKTQGADDTLQEKLALAYNNRGFLNYLCVEFTQAVQDYTVALNLDPSLAVAFYNRGLIRYRLGRFSEAVADQRKAVTLKPAWEPAEQCLRQSLQELEKTSQSGR